MGAASRFTDASRRLARAGYFFAASAASFSR